MQGGCTPSLLLEDLVACAPRLSKTWLRAAFILLLVGYGTKMGLAPMHTWKPDAYGESPGVIGAVFAGMRHELRLPRLPPRLPDMRGRGRGRLRLEAPALHGPLLDGGRRPLHGRPAGLQAHARLLQRRAHGHPRRSAWASAAPPCTARFSTWSPTRRPRACSSSRPATSIAPTPARAADEVRGRPRRLPLSGAAVFRGVLRDHGLAAVRALRQRVHDTQRRLRRRPLPGRGALPLLPPRRVHRDGQDDGQGLPGPRAEAVRRRSKARLSRYRPHRRADRGLDGDSPRCSGSTSRLPWIAMLSDAAKYLGSSI